MAQPYPFLPFLHNLIERFPKGIFFVTGDVVDKHVLEKHHLKQQRTATILAASNGICACIVAARFQLYISCTMNAIFLAAFIENVIKYFRVQF